MKTLYIYSYRPDPYFEEIDYDWFVGKDHEKYEDQEQEVIKYMTDERECDNAEDMLVDIYKQDRKVLLSELQES